MKSLDFFFFFGWKLDELPWFLRWITIYFDHDNEFISFEISYCGLNIIFFNWNLWVLHNVNIEKNHQQFFNIRTPKVSKYYYFFFFFDIYLFLQEVYYMSMIIPSHRPCFNVFLAKIQWALEFWMVKGYTI